MQVQNGHGVPALGIVSAKNGPQKRKFDVWTKLIWDKKFEKNFSPVNLKTTFSQKCSFLLTSFIYFYKFQDLDKEMDTYMKAR